MDVVLALTMEWQDGRLTWGRYDWSDIPIKTLQVDSEDIWTPHIDLANRIHDRFDERYLDTTLRFDGTISGILHITTLVCILGTVRQYRLFRANVNFGTDSMLYPYDTQQPSLKLQSLDYGDDKIHISTKTLNNLNGFDPKLLSVERLESLSNIQARFQHFGFDQIPD